VFWNWLGVGAGLFTGILLSPYMIRKLGPEGYGLWALSFALVEYYTFLDLGFRSATVKYVAHHFALQEWLQTNEIINTILVYSGIVSGFLFVLTVLASGYLKYFFKMTPEYERSFQLLIILMSISWCLGFVFNTFGACLEAIQRFDLYTKVNVSTTVLRAGGTAIILYLGYGLVGIGAWTVCIQCLGYALYFVSFRKAVPASEISPRFASLATLRRMGSFGIHTFIGNISQMALSQSPALLIGHYLPAKFVGFYNLPTRLIQYTGDAVGRIGIITNASAAEIQARGDSHVLSELAIYTNRYCVTLFMPLAIALWVFGDRVFRVWVPSVAQSTAPLLPILLGGYMIAVVGQFSSGMLLQGMGRHQRYSRALLVEAIVVAGSLVYVIPRYGIMGAAWVVAVCMVLDRGFFAPWLVSREMGFSFLHFMNSIYTVPTLVGIPVAALAWWLRITILPGNNLFQLAAMGAIVAASYLGLAFFFCLPREHRALLGGWLGRRIPFLKSVGAH